jgi:hypothetical protein
MKEYNHSDDDDGEDFGDDECEPLYDIDDDDLNSDLLKTKQDAQKFVFEDLFFSELIAVV